MIKLLLADAHSIIRNGLKVLLENTNEFTVSAEASNATEALNLLNSSHQFDIALIDLDHPVAEGMNFVKEMKSKFPEKGVAILSLIDAEDVIKQSFREGANAYLLKSICTNELILALKQVHNGKRFLCSDLTSRFIEWWIAQSKRKLGNRLLN